MSVSCYGDDPATTDLTMRLDGELAVGKTRNLIINNGTASPYAPDKIYSSDNSVLNCWQGTVSGVSAGTATVTAYYAAENKEVSLPITVAPNPSFAKPVSVSLKSNYTLTHGKSINASDLIESVMPENAAKDFKIKSSSSILYVNSTVLRAISPGKTTVTFVSRYDETVTATTEITVKHVAPTALEIVTSSDKFLPNDTYVFWARHTPKPYWYDAKWEVMSGKGKITENGVFTTKYFGKTVVRCTSTIDPTLTAEIEIDAKLFSDAYSFTRKLVGHMGLSAVLGFGIFGSTFLLTKRKWLCAVLTPTLSIFYAAVSELIQKFTPGRVCALTDVLIDFLGAMTGAAAGFLLVATVCAIWRVVAKKSFADFFCAYKNLNVKTAFGKTEKQ